jgi:hypothetical protein
MKGKSKRAATAKRAKRDLPMTGNKSRAVKGGIIIIGGIPAVSNAPAARLTTRAANVV